MKRFFHLAVVLSLVSHLSLLISACTQDAYEKGEGKYSLMRADFVEAHADLRNQIDYFTTDEGERLSVEEPFTAKWVVKSDSVYRCIIYYNKVKAGNGDYMADVVTYSQVPCPLIMPLSDFEDGVVTDPVRFESAWMSPSGHYLNLSLFLMTGTTDDKDAVQSLAIVSDTLMTNPDATRTLHLRLHHDRAGVPEYYSSQVYASIPVAALDADSVRISISTYQGHVVRVFPLAE